MGTPWILLESDMKLTWVLFLVISLVYSVAWLVSMGMAGGIVLKPFRLDQIGMTVILAVCILYTIFGGLYSYWHRLHPKRNHFSWGQTIVPSSS